VKVIKYNEDEIWMFIRLKNLIKESLQIVFDKNDEKES